MSKLISYNKHEFIINKNGIKHNYQYDIIDFIKIAGLPRYDNQFLYKKEKENIYTFYCKDAGKDFSLRTNEDVELFIDECKKHNIEIK